MTFSVLILWLYVISSSSPWCIHKGRICVWSIFSFFTGTKWLSHLFGTRYIICNYIHKAIYLYLYTYTYIHVCIYMYMYIYVFIYPPSSSHFLFNLVNEYVQRMNVEFSFKYRFWLHKNIFNISCLIIKYLQKLSYNKNFLCANDSQ